jgi:hypothetical protein
LEFLVNDLTTTRLPWKTEGILDQGKEILRQEADTSLLTIPDLSLGVPFYRERNK